MTFEWPYFDLREGKLFYDDGARALPNAPSFTDRVEAEAWLIDNDERGTIR